MGASCTIHAGIMHVKMQSLFITGAKRVLNSYEIKWHTQNGNVWGNGKYTNSIMYYVQYSNEHTQKEQNEPSNQFK